MKALFFFAALTLAATDAYSQVVVVAGADRVGASTIDVPLGDAPFRVERTGRRTIDLVTPLSSPDYDLTQLVRGDRARRILSARALETPDGYRLRLVLACDCENSVSLADGVVQLRISEPAQRLDKDTSEERLAVVAPRIAAPGGTINAPRFSPVPRTRRDSKIADPAPAPLSIDDPLDETDGEDEVTLARRKLLEQLSMAAEQGLLDLVSEQDADRSVGLTIDEVAPNPIATEKDTTQTTVAPRLENDSAENEAAFSADSATAVPEPAPAPLELPVRARSAIEQTFRADRSDTIVSKSECVEDWRLDMTGWTGDVAFNDGVSAYFSALTDQFGDPVAEPVNGLIRLYIASGFGAEASKLLKLYEDVVVDPAILFDIAMITDGSPPAPNGPIVNAARCSGGAAMWSDAAGLQAPDGVAPKNIGALVEDALERAPRAVRLNLGPRLLEYRLDQGDIEGARRVDAILKRIPGDSGPAFDMARAKLLAAQGRDAASEALLRTVANSDAPESRSALLRLVEDRLEADEPVGEELESALEDASLLSRGGAFERDVKIAQIRALAQRGGLASALSEVKREFDRDVISDDVLHDAAHAVLEDATPPSGDPLPFVETVLENRDLIAKSASGDEARVNLSLQLTEIGLPALGLEILEPANQRSSLGLQLARANAFLGLGSPERSLEVLQGAPGSAAAKLRVTAFAAMQDYPAALELAAATDLNAPIGDIAFLARDWGLAAADGDTQPALRSLAQVMLRANAPESDAADPLQNGDEAALAAGRSQSAEGDVRLEDVRLLLTGSQAARSVIREALEDG